MLLCANGQICGKEILTMQHDYNNNHVCTYKLQTTLTDVCISGEKFIMKEDIFVTAVHNTK